MESGAKRCSILAMALSGTIPPSLLVRRMVSIAASPGVVSVLCSSTTRY
ncbi:Uncharacterised protein [Citrobacter koseri]|uniref:Uncharacterized protein n=1 Tax=Citrobacter koseri TaxID=545 RepID=A0A3S4I3V5_CITKO|nr:Uncharacterised protein [Citrobacter koseri]